MNSAGQTEAQLRQHAQRWISGIRSATVGRLLIVYLGAVLFKIGSLSFGFLVPALAGYIA